VELLQYLRGEGLFRQPAIAPPPCLILLDVNMPRKDGREALRELKKDTHLCRLPVIALSTSRTPDEVCHLYELGANSYISKPVGFRELTRVMTVLRRYWFQTAELPEDSHRRHVLAELPQAPPEPPLPPNLP